MVKQETEKQVILTSLKQNLLINYIETLPWGIPYF